MFTEGAREENERVAGKTEDRREREEKQAPRSLSEVEQCANN